MIRDRPRSPPEIRVVRSLEWNRNYGVRSARPLAALLACVTGLSSFLATRCWSGRSAFDVRWIARRRSGGVGGVLIQPSGQLSDLQLEGLHLLLILMNEGQDRRLGCRRYLAPKFNRNRRNRLHTNILRPLYPQTGSGRERLPARKSVPEFSHGAGRFLLPLRQGGHLPPCGPVAALHRPVFCPEPPGRPLPRASVRLSPSGRERLHRLHFWSS